MIFFLHFRSLRNPAIQRFLSRERACLAILSFWTTRKIHVKISLCFRALEPSHLDSVQGFETPKKVGTIKYSVQNFGGPTNRTFETVLTTSWNVYSTACATCRHNPVFRVENYLNARGVWSEPSCRAELISRALLKKAPIPGHRFTSTLFPTASPHCLRSVLSKATPTVLVP